jgi:hypothetical protein
MQLQQSSLVMQKIDEGGFPILVKDVVVESAHVGLGLRKGGYGEVVQF